MPQLSLHREVFKAKHRQTGKKVALKKVLMENEKEGVRGRSESTVIVHLMFSQASAECLYVLDTCIALRGVVDVDSTWFGWFSPKKSR